VTEEIASRQKVRTVNVEARAPSVSTKPTLPSKLAVNETTTHRWSFLEDVTAYSESGFGAIGVWLPKLVQFGEERGIELIRDSEISVSSVSWAGGFTGWNGQSFYDSIVDARAAVKTAGELNAESLVVISGARCGHTLSHAHQLLVDALKILADDAGEFGLSLALQPMFSREWSFLTSLDETLEIIDECNHPLVRMAFDVSQLWKEPHLLERIPEIASLVTTLQLCDRRNPPRCEFDQLLPGDGEIPLGEITQAFLDAEYDGSFEIKIWSEELWNSDYSELLRTCRSRLESLCLSGSADGPMISC
jgi:sugar phosphate isomerase/epimerase